MSIIINNTTVVKNSAEQLYTEISKIDSTKQLIENILAELNEYWGANQEDQKAFYNNLKNDVSELETICSCNKKFAGAIIKYMNVTETTSATTIGG